MPFKDIPKGATHYAFHYLSAFDSNQYYYFKVLGPVNITYWNRILEKWIITSWSIDKMGKLPPTKVSIEEKLLNAF